MDNTKTAQNAACQTDGRKLRAALRSNLLYNHYLPSPTTRPLVSRVKRG